MVFVAGGDQFFQLEVFKIIGKIVKEITDARIISFAINYLAFEVFFVMPQFFFDVRQLSIKLILLLIFRFMQILIF